jgi:hypothetical protein
MFGSGAEVKARLLHELAWLLERVQEQDRIFSPLRGKPQLTAGRVSAPYGLGTPEADPIRSRLTGLEAPS